MASQHTIQGYLEAQKVGVLFEELMQKLIKEMPNEPLPFLIRILQKKYDKQSASLAKSGDDFFESGVRKSTDAYGDLAVEKTRGYDKPWQSNAKRVKSKKLAEHEIIGPSQTAKKSEEHHGHEKRKKNEKGQERRRNVRQFDDEDDLASELQAPKSLRRETELEKMSNISPSIDNHKRKSGNKANAEKHKKDLEKMILEQKSKQDVCVIEKEDDAIDNADELLENADDLREEGVTNISVSGHKQSKSKGHKAVAPQVNVGVCAWCARLLTGDSMVKSKGSKSKAKEESSSSSSDSDTTSKSSVSVKKGKSQKVVSVDEEDDDDFESVSQVTGPRAPVWEDNDSDTATLTPRKGSHMLAKSVQPVKGRSFLHEFTGPPSPTPRSARTVTLKDDRAYTPNRTWSAGMKTEDLVKPGLSARSTDFFNQKRQGWNVTEDSEGSTVDFDNERPKSYRGYRKK